MAGPKSSSAPLGAAPADSPAATAGDALRQPVAKPVAASAPSAADSATTPTPVGSPLAASAASPTAGATAASAPISAPTAKPAAPAARKAASTRPSANVVRSDTPPPVEALSAYEEELLRAYSPTLAGTYERWKEEGEGMPLVLAVMLRQWRSSGCPVDRLTEGQDQASSAASDRAQPLRADGGAAFLQDVNNAEDADLQGLSQGQAQDGSQSCYESCFDNSCHDCPKRALDLAEGGNPDAAHQEASPSGAAATGCTAAGSGAASSTPTASALAKAKSPLLRESAPRAKAKPEKSDKNAQMTLPGVSVPRTPGETAPMSNYLARTSLFAPIRKGRRVMHDKQMLHSPEGIDVLYTGKQLDMADQDVYLTALRLAGGIKAGDRILINRAAFLRMLGYKHNPGARDYKWLEESFYRISTGRVIIKAKHIEANLPLMGALLTDTRSGDYYFTIPRETYALWAKNLYSYIDLEKRHALERNVPLSKWLQSYAQSHAPGTHTISMDLLHLWCGYGGRLRDFRDSLTGALEELTRVGILTSWSIQERGKGRQKKIMISWVRERTHRDDAPPPLVEE